jgi:hypothetical protein
MSSHVLIDVSVERAWELIEDADRWPEWADVCVAVSDAPGRGGWRVGHEFGFRLRMPGIIVPFNVVVSRFETGKLIKWKSTKFSITVVRTISVESADSGCRVTDSKHFSSRLLPIRLAYPRWMIRRMTESWLSDLKRESESLN